MLNLELSEPGGTRGKPLSSPAAAARPPSLAMKSALLISLTARIGMRRSGLRVSSSLASLTSSPRNAGRKASASSRLLKLLSFDRRPMSDLTKQLPGIPGQRLPDLSRTESRTGAIVGVDVLQRCPCKISLPIHVRRDGVSRMISVLTSDKEQML